MEPLPILIAGLALVALVALVLWRRLRAARQELAAARAALGLRDDDPARLDAALRTIAEEEGQLRGAAGSLERDLRSLADAVDAGLLRLDRSGRVVSANPAAHELLGRPAGSLVGRSAREALIDRQLEALAAGPLTALPARLDLERPDGSALAALVGAAPAGGRWLLLRDASELLRLRRIRTEFVDNLSHELRTPVTTIGLLAESLALEAGAEGSGVPERLRERIARIEHETGHLGQMVAELLDLARVESGKGIERSEPVDLLALAGSAVERMRPFAERAQVRLEVDGEPVPPVLGDPGRLEQVLVNLIHNAVKFSNPGGRVEVRVAPSDGSVRVSVRDEGIGIEPADQTRLFERFYKADRARTRGGGTGLGLAIARHVVEAHGGRIEVVSAPGRGSTFTVVVPLEDGAGRVG